MSPTGNTTRAPGFTLIETLVVIIVVGVLTAMIVPQLGGTMRTAGLRESARTLLRTMQYARAHAISQRRQVRLVLDLQEHAYQLEHEPDPLAEPGQFEPLRREGIQRRTLPQNVEFAEALIRSTNEQPSSQGEVSAINFTPRGKADAAVLVLSDGSRVWTIRTSPHTGRIDIQNDEVGEFLEDREDLDQ